jgi:hypothetical protein
MVLTGVVCRAGIVEPDTARVSDNDSHCGRNISMKLRLALATAALAGIGLLGLTACQHGVTAGSAGDDATVTLTAEQTALTTLGYSEDDVISDVPAGDGTPAPTASGSTAPGKDRAGNGRHRRFKRLGVRRALARNVEHGEIVVDTKDGAKTIVVQRGTVTAITATSITVKSADGYTATWTFGSPLHVIEHRTTIQPKDVAVGATVGVAGTKQGDADVASLIVLPKA